MTLHSCALISSMNSTPNEVGRSAAKIRSRRRWPTDILVLVALVTTALVTTVLQYLDWKGEVGVAIEVQASSIRVVPSSTVVVERTATRQITLAQVSLDCASPGSRSDDWLGIDHSVLHRAEYVRLRDSAAVPVKPITLSADGEGALQLLADANNSAFAGTVVRGPKSNGFKLLGPDDLPRSAPEQCAKTQALDFQAKSIGVVLEAGEEAIVNLPVEAIGFVDVTGEIKSSIHKGSVMLLPRRTWLYSFEGTVGSPHPLSHGNVLDLQKGRCNERKLEDCALRVTVSAPEDPDYLKIQIHGKVRELSLRETTLASGETLVPGYLTWTVDSHRVLWSGVTAFGAILHLRRFLRRRLTLIFRPAK